MRRAPRAVFGRNLIVLLKLVGESALNWHGASQLRNPRVSKDGRMCARERDDTNTPQKRPPRMSRHPLRPRLLFHDFPVAPQIITLTITCRLRCESSKLIIEVIAFVLGSPRRIKGDVRPRGKRQLRFRRWPPYIHAYQIAIWRKQNSN